jgi:hypothetical protein
VWINFYRKKLSNFIERTRRYLDTDKLLESVLIWWNLYCREVMGLLGGGAKWEVIRSTGDVPLEMIVDLTGFHLVLWFLPRTQAFLMMPSAIKPSSEAELKRPLDLELSISKTVH